MDFDLQNFGLGLLVGWGTAYALYRSRTLLTSASATVRQSAVDVGNSATRSADGRYVNDLVSLAERSHLAGEFVKLTDVLVEPFFLPAPAFAAPRELDVFQSVFDLVPQHADHPHLHAPYNTEALSIDDLAKGSRALALLGVPGSGRTTALLTIALRSLGRARFTPPPDKVQAQLDSADAKLSEKDRAVRIKERVTMEQRAKEKLASESGGQFDVDLDESVKSQLPLFNTLMPIYVHLADVLLRTGEYGGEIDPAEPLIRAVQSNVGRATASNIPRNLYRRVQEGHVLLLIDGYDEIPSEDQPFALAWIKAMMTMYKSNFVIVAGPAVGFGALTDLGLTPVYTRPWSEQDAASYLDKWIKIYPSAARRMRRKAAPPPDAVVARARVGNRGLLPAEIALKTWATLTDDIDAPGIEGWMRAFVARHLPDPKTLDAQLADIGSLAALQLDTRLLTIENARALTLRHEVAPEAAETPSESTDEAKPARGRAKDAKPAEPQTPHARLLGALRRTGLLIEDRGSRYRFRHPVVASYLAALSLNEASPALTAEKAALPAWQEAIAYAAAFLPFDSLVEARLNAPNDVLRENVIGMGRWLAFAPATAAWRGTLFRLYGTMMSAPNQYPLLRERALAALVESRDTKSALLIFRRAVRNMDAQIRRLGCIGMGALGDPEAIRDLSALLRDQDEDVRTASTLALGAIGTPEALDPIMISLNDGTDRVQQAAAETLAALPDDGYPLLYEAISAPEMTVRRAAVSGLRRLNTTWAFVSVYRAFLDDDQWFVNSAAQQAFQERQMGRAINPTASYPSADGILWLNEWIAAKGEKPLTGERAYGMLTRALQEGEPELRSLAALNLAQLGAAENTKTLYSALRDKQEGVRAAAHQALAWMQLRIGHSLPAPN